MTYELRVLLFFILSPARAVYGRAVSFYTVEGIAGRDRNDKSYRGTKTFANRLKRTFLCKVHGLKLLYLSEDGLWSEEF